MNPTEKMDFIQSHLYLADEGLINEFYEMLCKDTALKCKLESRAIKAENDIQTGNLFSREELEKRIF
ncbi:hypothetical protein [Williamwhitmania taraxaci]|uniref:Uncharacterized protein n=1 Tax=Williamwhitmania taraxaci TaxID=1640674 RepID=A0A1G6SJR1_9BACT|nr:hypothetical protein [Williamwhitmania taraxaci]SDD16914.1 hypothetical protein SAMN05216323_109510 [Williamwhitmania taraxaci]